MIIKIYTDEEHEEKVMLHQEEDCEIARERVKNSYWNDCNFRKYIEMNGYHFTDKLADFATKEMKNTNEVDHNWTTAQVRTALFGFLPSKASWGDVAYSANMAYADFYPLLNNDNSCLIYAKLDAEDCDATDGKIFRRWLSDIMESDLKVGWQSFI